jgi:ribonuclease HI
MESQSLSISNDGSQRGSRTPIGRNVRGTERGKRGGRGSGSGGGRGSFSSEKYVHGVNGDLVIRFDGACRGNPGPGAIGVVAYRCVDVSIHRQVQDKIHLKTFAEVQEYFQGPTTNNEMEYTAIIHALNVAQRRLTHEQLVSQMNSFTNKIIFQGDSSLVVKQVLTYPTYFLLFMS